VGVAVLDRRFCSFVRLPVMRHIFRHIYSCYRCIWSVKCDIIKDSIIIIIAFLFSTSILRDEIVAWGKINNVGAQFQNTLRNNLSTCGLELWGKTIS